VIDQNFINDLPENVDVCGETANFIPSLLMGLFSKPIDFEIGEIVYRKYEKPKRIPQTRSVIRRNRCV
jgi:hypothetical protein